MMQPVVPLLVLAVALCSCRSAPRLEQHGAGEPEVALTLSPEPPAERLRVLTYNIHVYNPDLPSTSAVIAEADADVVCLQETVASSQAALCDALCERYPYRAFHVGPVGNGPTILSRRPFTGARYLPSREGVNGSWVGTFELDRRPLALACVHLHPTLPAGLNPFGVLTTYAAAEAVRRREITELVTALGPPGPLVLAGDLNTLRSTATYGDLLRLGLRDALLDLGAHTSTFRGAPVGLALDYVLHSAGLTADDARVLGGGTSDHLPVVATLRWSTEHEPG